MTVGYRPFPADGWPVVGPLPGSHGAVYIAVCHSGVTHAPFLGKAVAAEVGHPVGVARCHVLLAPYRPGRSVVRGAAGAMDSGLPKARGATAL